MVTYQKTPTEIEVLYFGEHYKVLNDNKIKRKFYKAVDFSIGVVLGIDSNKSKFKIGKSGIKFRDYTHYELDFYGMARRGTIWKGNRMLRIYNN